MDSKIKGGYKMMRNGNTKSSWLLFLLILAGIVIGGFLGECANKVPYLAWLGYGESFGLTAPLVLDLGVLNIQFALSVRITIAGILGLLLAVLSYRKL